MKEGSIVMTDFEWKVNLTTFMKMVISLYVLSRSVGMLPLPHKEDKVGTSNHENENFQQASSKWKRTLLSWRISNESQIWQLSQKWNFHFPSSTQSGKLPLPHKEAKVGTSKPKIKIFTRGAQIAWASDFRCGDTWGKSWESKFFGSRKSKKCTKVGPPPFLYYEEDTSGEGAMRGPRWCDGNLIGALTGVSKPRFNFVKWVGKWLFWVGNAIQGLFSFGEVDFTKERSEWDCIGGQDVLGVHAVRVHVQCRAF